MAGVTDFCDFIRMVGTNPTPDSTVIARYLDGEILAAVKNDRSVVTLDTYPGVYYGWTGQGDVLVHNAVMWLAAGDISWLDEVSDHRHDTRRDRLPGCNGCLRRQRTMKSTSRVPIPPG